MPLLLKLMVFVVVAYFLSPIDMIPDFIPVLGYLDELLLLPLAIYLTFKPVPEPGLTECRIMATRWVAEHCPTPRSIAGAIFIMVLWILLFAMPWNYSGDTVFKLLHAA